MKGGSVEIPLKMILATAAVTGLIGRNNQIPWHLRSDLRRFKKITTGKVVLMGMNTAKSMDYKPLPNRVNIVLSRRDDLNLSGFKVARTMEIAIDLANQEAQNLAEPEIFVIGGAKIYDLFLPFVQEIMWTEVLTPQVSVHQGGDVFYPVREIVMNSAWVQTHEEQVPFQEHDDCPSAFRIYRRAPAIN